jgi:hypothetical protein
MPKLFEKQIRKDSNKLLLIRGNSNDHPLTNNFLARMVPKTFWVGCQCPASSSRHLWPQPSWRGQQKSCQFLVSSKYPRGPFLPGRWWVDRLRDQFMGHYFFYHTVPRLDLISRPACSQTETIPRDCTARVQVFCPSFPNGRNTLHRWHLNIKFTELLVNKLQLLPSDSFIM